MAENEPKSKAPRFVPQGVGNLKNNFVLRPVLKYIYESGGGGRQSSEVAFALLTQLPWFGFSVVPNLIFHVAEIY